MRHSILNQTEGRWNRFGNQKPEQREGKLTIKSWYFHNNKLLLGRFLLQTHWTVKQKMVEVLTHYYQRRRVRIVRAVSQTVVTVWEKSKHVNAEYCACAQQEDETGRETQEGILMTSLENHKWENAKIDPTRWSYLLMLWFSVLQLVLRTEYNN